MIEKETQKVIDVASRHLGEKQSASVTQGNSKSGRSGWARWEKTQSEKRRQPDRVRHVIILCGWHYESVLSSDSLFLNAQNFCAHACHNFLWETPQTLDLSSFTDIQSHKWALPIMTFHTFTTITDHTGQTRWVFSSPRNLVFHFLHPGSVFQLPLWCPWLHYFPSTHT